MIKLGVRHPRKKERKKESESESLSIHKELEEKELVL